MFFHERVDMHNRFYRCAVIDIGANSVRMNIYDINTESREYSIAASARNMLGLAALAVVVVAHGDQDEITVSPFAYTCHCC